MIVWINGIAGPGKDAVVRELLGLLPGSTRYDPGELSPVLHGMLPVPPGGSRRLPDSPAWRKLTADTAAALLAEVPGPLIVPMELLRRQDRDEVFGLLAGYGLPVHHVLLDAADTADAPALPATSTSPDTEETILRRAALRWLREDAFAVELGTDGARTAAEKITAALGTGRARCEIVRTPAREGDTIAAAVLLFDQQQRVLLVDPTYKPGWEFPGGVVEPGERPSLAAVRELHEELGLDLPAESLRLLVVDWEAAPPGRHGGLRLVFDGGSLDESRQRSLRLPTAELRRWRFATPHQAAGMLPPQRAHRLTAALTARTASRIHYLESSEPPTVPLF